MYISSLTDSFVAMFLIICGYLLLILSRVSLP